MTHELILDSNPSLNLASFVITLIEPKCDKFIMSAFNKNNMDIDKYPITSEIQVEVSLFLTAWCNCVIMACGSGIP